MPDWYWKSQFVLAGVFGIIAIGLFTVSILFW